MKYISIFCALFALGTALFAQTEADFEVALTEDGNGAVIKKYTGKVTNTIRIPPTIEGLPVREIGKDAFMWVGTVYDDSRGMLKTDVPFAVVLPQGLIKIGVYAFAASALTGVVIPDSVTEIGPSAFENNVFYMGGRVRLNPPDPLLASVTLPKGLTKVGSGVFAGNRALKTVVIPEGCSVLGEEMFKMCTALAAITIPKSITSIPSGAFWGCSGLKTLVLPEGLTKIGGRYDGRGGAFFACTALTSVTLPSTITAIGEGAFGGCSALTTVTIPDSVETIDGGNAVYGEKTLLEWAFSECGKLSLAVQARLKKITVVSYQKEREKLEQAQKQREQEERAAQAKRDQEKREAERAAQAKRVQEERAAQAKREQEERAAQAKREQEERAAQAKREQEEQAKRDEEMRVEQEKLAEATRTVSAFQREFAVFPGRARGMNNKQFAEFMDVYEKYIASGLENLNTSGWRYIGYSERQDFEWQLKQLEDNIYRCMGGMNDRQKRTFNAKFK
jgi:hypothetical protein